MRSPHKKTHLPAYMPVLLAVILAGAVLIAGCASQSASVAKTTAPQTSAVKVADILKDPAAYAGKNVTVEGKITNECGSGCWFMLDDGTGTLYVDLAPNNFAIPQLRGTTVVVQGTIGVVNGDPTLVGTLVAADSRSWP